MPDDAAENRCIAKQIEQLVRYFPQFALHEGSGGRWLTGSVRLRGGLYRLMCVFPAGFSEQGPEVYVIEPHELPTVAGGTVNALGANHAFHTGANGPNGCVQIDYPRKSGSHPTLISDILGAVVWLEAYSAHLRDGRAPRFRLG